MTANMNELPSPKSLFFRSVGLILFTNVVLYMMGMILQKIYGSLAVHFMPLALAIIGGLFLLETIFMMVRAAQYAIWEPSFAKAMRLLAFCLVIFVALLLSWTVIPQSTFDGKYDDPSREVVIDGRVHYLTFFPAFPRIIQHENSPSSDLNTPNFRVILYDCDNFRLICNVKMESFYQGLPEQYPLSELTSAILSPS
jgi:hypothetical protein